MTATLSRAKALRNDIENMKLSRKYLIGVLAELEQLGRTHTASFKSAERTIQTINHNIKMLERELDEVEAKEFDQDNEELEDPRYFSAREASFKQS